MKITVIGVLAIVVVAIAALLLVRQLSNDSSNASDPNAI